MKFRSLVLMFGLMLAVSAQAGYGTAKVGQVMVGRLGNQVYVELLTQSYSGWPCATTHPSGFRYAFLLTSPGARDMLATILSAQVSGQSLQVVGSGSCSIDPTLEDIAYVVLRP